MGPLALVAGPSTVPSRDHGVTPRSKVGSVEVAHTRSPEVKGLAANPESPMESTNGVVEEAWDLNKGLLLVPFGTTSGTMSGEDVVPLVSLPPLNNIDGSSSDWVSQKVNEIQHIVGISHGGCENQFKALLIAIEVSHSRDTKSSFKKSRELKRLSCAINYDAKGGSSSRGHRGCFIP
ncbi:hypothetical protein F2P56_006276 [Juglans regia]|uniref:Uncharacterized protein n=1 Tax=Juglans regia TaxID=51240 RepID=A0A833Y0P4_JUGRE|nr:hypothetical protein F2P56_006276 [Juglans regia]